MQLVGLRGLLGILMLFSLLACKQQGIINKVKYEGKKITNTCKDFEDEVKALIEANQGTSQLRISEFDNSQFNYYYLEPGQFEQIKDTLYFRLINDIVYEKYLHKGVAIEIHAEYQAQEHLKHLEKSVSGKLGTLRIDRKYFDRNSYPYFIYKLPVGQNLNGKNLNLKFSVVQYDKKGRLKKVFCNSVDVPIGPLDPSCCTDKPWVEVKPKTIVKIPDIEIKDENYRYKGFTGTLDLIFPMNSAKYTKKSREEFRDVILNYISKYENVGYTLTAIHIEGYASQGGKVDYNQKLSEARCQTVQKDLEEHFRKINREGQVRITAKGNGEDWERFILLAKIANFTEEEREQVLQIANSPEDPDVKEAKLRKLPFYWKKLVPEVMEHCRHTFITFTFDYHLDKMYYENFPNQIPIISPELYNVATKVHTIVKYRKGVDPNANLRILNYLIDENGNKKPNLFAMRSGYHYVLSDPKSAIADIETAYQMEATNYNYSLLGLAYKTAWADNYSLSERLRILNDYSTFLSKNPNDPILRFNQAVMMEKVGYLSGALAEYDGMLAKGESEAVLLNNRAVARLKASRLTEAEADLLEALRLNPQLAEAHFNLAIIYAWRGLTYKVIENLDKVIALEPSYKCEITKNPVFRQMRKNPLFAEKYNNICN
ncbi:MAG: OmpA family protein [Bacteroidia bacterium]|nr:OmpA family protein [Bacteroidia bacterium]MDW8158269.1 OmpA family protein [Bacteroidia bacterium]